LPGPRAISGPWRTRRRGFRTLGTDGLPGGVRVVVLSQIHYQSYIPKISTSLEIST
jgi:hypothetical protein